MMVPMSRSKTVLAVLGVGGAIIIAIVAIRFHFFPWIALLVLAVAAVVALACSWKHTTAVWWWAGALVFILVLCLAVLWVWPWTASVGADLVCNSIDFESAQQAELAFACSRVRVMPMQLDGAKLRTPIVKVSSITDGTGKEANDLRELVGYIGKLTIASLGNVPPNKPCITVETQPHQFRPDSSTSRAEKKVEVVCDGSGSRHAEMRFQLHWRKARDGKGPLTITSPVVNRFTFDSIESRIVLVNCSVVAEDKRTFLIRELPTKSGRDQQRVINIEVQDTSELLTLDLTRRSGAGNPLAELYLPEGFPEKKPGEIQLRGGQMQNPSFLIESGTVKIEDHELEDLTKPLYANALVEFVGIADPRPDQQIQLRSDGFHILLCGEATSVTIDGREKKSPLLFYLIDKYRLAGFSVVVTWLLMLFTPFIPNWIRCARGTAVQKKTATSGQAHEGKENNYASNGQPPSAGAARAK